jgi:hypothetical protein
MPDTNKANGVRRPDPMTGPGPHDAVQRLTWTEITLLIVAVAVGAVCAANDARAFERPTRDGVDDLPVWSVQRCTPEGCQTLPLVLKDGRRVLVTRRYCVEIRDQAARQLRGDRLVCRPEPEAVDQQLGRLQVVR